jgi:hypothetical protein
MISTDCELDSPEHTSRNGFDVAAALLGGRTCNTPGVYHQLSSGFKLKHDRFSVDDDAKVKPMEINPNLNLDVEPSLTYRLN